MSYILAVFLAFLQTAPPPLNSVIDGVDRTFARMKDFSADFVQIEQNSLNRRDQASGHLYLARPRMRWEYKVPEEQLYVSDGKMLYHFIPADRQVREYPVRDTLDDRIPLMLLVGRSNLKAEFTKFERPATKPVIEGMTVIKMYPKRQTDLADIVIEVEPSTFLIRRLVLTQADGSFRDLRFSNVQINTGLKNDLFEFKIPPGVELLKGLENKQ